MEIELNTKEIEQIIKTHLNRGLVSEEVFFSNWKEGNFPSGIVFTTEIKKKELEEKNGN